MGRYILKRLLLIIPTLFGIMVVNFIIVQTAPGGPVEQALAMAKYGQMPGDTGKSTQIISGSGTDTSQSGYRGAQGLNSELVKKIEQMYGFDKPPVERFFIMMWRYIRFDFDDSFFYGKNVIQLIFERLPVSLSLGLWTMLIVYLVSIPLGIRKAVKHGTKFDAWTSGVIAVFYAIPSFLFALLLITLFSAGNPLKLFPLRGLVSDNWATFPWWQQVSDYIWHIILPVLALVLGGFASLTLLTKNSFLEEINKQYVITARAKGLAPNKILYGHVFRNAMLIVIAGFPGSLIRTIFTGSLLIEILFSLDGIGLLGFTAILKRDYPIIFGELFFFTLLGLLIKIINDLMYRAVDPRINFESQGL
ncbi:MAG: microcin C ABC transporter permease YejB [Spirochaetaceae bacterium]|nr:MAG: microcin C ABC transporter permease YejB [Spirochaetaceae bacterium]